MRAVRERPDGIIPLIGSHTARLGEPFWPWFRKPEPEVIFVTRPDPYQWFDPERGRQ